MSEHDRLLRIAEAAGVDVDDLAKYEERAAIIEHEGRRTREVAERAAASLTWGGNWVGTLERVREALRAAKNPRSKVG